MIRAVTRCTLEINQTGSPYFERAICFVKPEFYHSDRLDLHRAAKHLIADFDSCVEEKLSCEDDADNAEEASWHCTAMRLVRRFLPMALSAIIGAGITLLLTLLF